MTDGQTYYDGLIAQGYPAEQALGYTQQYYPGFSPAVAAPAPMPMPAPIPAQPVAQAQAIPSLSQWLNQWHKPFRCSNQ